MSDFQWAYEATLREVFDPHVIVWIGPRESYGSVERTPFENVSRKPLFDRYTYQAAMRSDPMPGSEWDLMQKEGLGPSARSGGRRSGVIVFDGAKIIGSHTDPGYGHPAQNMLYVDPEYRGKGIAQHIFIAWWNEFPRHKNDHARQVFNQQTAWAVLNAFPKYLEACQAAGKPVPGRVVGALAVDRVEILRRIDAAQQASQARPPRRKIGRGIYAR